MSRWIVNASPIIVLARMGQVDLLRRLPTVLIIPAAVAAEVEAGPADDPGRIWLAGPGRTAIRDDPAMPPSIAAWDLGTGESAVLAWAYRQAECEIVVDDHAARQCGQAFGVRVLGTVGVLLRAKHRGLIEMVGPLLWALPRHGCHIAQSLVREALRLAGEAESNSPSSPAGQTQGEE
jgi:predicted nucleic acid-binding protein